MPFFTLNDGSKVFYREEESGSPHTRGFLRVCLLNVNSKRQKEKGKRFRCEPLLSILSQRTRRLSADADPVLSAS
jgi:hypothetical protein